MWTLTFIRYITQANDFYPEYIYYMSNRKTNSKTIFDVVREIILYTMTHIEGQWKLNL